MGQCSHAIVAQIIRNGIRGSREPLSNKCFRGGSQNKKNDILGGWPCDPFNGCEPLTERSQAPSQAAGPRPHGPAKITSTYRQRVKRRTKSALKLTGIGQVRRVRVCGQNAEIAYIATNMHAKLAKIGQVPRARVCGQNYEMHEIPTKSSEKIPVASGRFILMCGGYTPPCRSLTVTTI